MNKRDLKTDAVVRIMVVITAESITVDATEALATLWVTNVVSVVADARGTSTTENCGS